jgi:uncharacterized UPF0160 family protein
LKFALYKDERNMFRIQAISLTPSSFENRVSLCKDWRGIRDQELADKSGIESIAFVHHSGFIGGAWKLEDAIKMAELSLKEHADVAK